jgi:hypothetical protein
MAMRAPLGAENAGEERKAIPNDDPVLLAILNAPLDDEPETEAEREAIREWKETGIGIDGAIVSAEIAARAAEER